MEEMAELMTKREAGGELADLPCPFCGKPRSQRSNYIRCQACATNWIQEEMHLPGYLNRNPAAARSEAARTTIVAPRPSATSSVAAAE